MESSMVWHHLRAGLGVGKDDKVPHGKHPSVCVFMCGCMESRKFQTSSLPLREVFPRGSCVGECCLRRGNTCDSAGSRLLKMSKAV
eukprot:8432851-Pyramimonas_sp.AAC.1